MATNKLKVILSFLREISDGNIPKATDYGLKNQELWDIVEICQDEGLIKGAAHADSVLFFEDTKLTLKGLEYLNENSKAMRTYKGLKELRDWLPF